MAWDKIDQWVTEVSSGVNEALAQPETYTQLGIIIIIYAFAFILANRIRKWAPFLGIVAEKEQEQEREPAHPLHRFVSKIGNLIFPILAIMLLRVSLEISQGILNQGWLVQTALTIAVLLLFNSIINAFVSNRLLGKLFKWVGIPLILLHLLGILSVIIAILESISISIGNITISAYGIARVTIFGSLLFWLGRVSNKTGKEIISRQETLDLRTREVASKLLEVTIFFVIFILLLQVMGINLTALAVFGGALGVGLGFGLQAIASNFISGIIILMDRSLTIGDYVELADGRTGMVRHMDMRSTTLETFDGKDIMVPNEKFIVETFTNWTHKNKSQRYRVDFSVAYSTDVRKLVEIIKEVVTSHPQVFSGEDVPFEERPDCEIDSFGESGINMFVEFWMEGIDDGKNRVGGDLLLMILEALQEHGFQIPFPQREVRVLNKNFSVNREQDRSETS